MTLFEKDLPNPNGPSPVSNEAAEAAFMRAFGGSVVDMAVYGRFVRETFRRQQAMDAGLQLTLRAAQALYGPGQVLPNNYTGSALAYFAGRQEQATLDRIKVPRLSKRNFASILVEDMIAGGGAGHVPALLAFLSREFGASDFAQYVQSHHPDQDFLRDHELEVLVLSPDAEENVQVLSAIATAAMAGANARMTVLAAAEPDFLNVVYSRWTEDDPRFRFSVLAGAADMSQALANAVMERQP